MAPLATPLDEQLVRRSVEALLTHVKRNAAKDGKAQLLDESVPISVIIAMKAIPDTNGRTKPYMMCAPDQPSTSSQLSRMCKTLPLLAICSFLPALGVSAASSRIRCTTRARRRCALSSRTPSATTRSALVPLTGPEIDERVRREAYAKFKQ